MTRLSGPLLALFFAVPVLAAGDGPRVPAIEPVESAAFERFAVTLVPGTFLVAPHPFRAAGSDTSSSGSAQATSDEARTLFVGITPGRALHVVRGEGDRRWAVYDVTVLDPSRTRVQRAVPSLPPGVRVLLEKGRVVFEGAVVKPEDVGALEVVAAMHPEAENRVRVGTPLPPP